MRNRSIFTIALMLCVAISAFAQSVVQESLTFPSRKLNKEIPYSIYLPDDYATSQRTYPVLYLLHGYSDDETAWIQFGKVKETADRLIASGDAVPMIIVMPDAWDTWYLNSYDGAVPYEDMFIEELFPYMEQNYRIKSRRESRAIAGLSMGGYGSMLYALKHPDLFTACAPLSAAIFDDSVMEYRKDNTHKAIYGRLFGPGDAHWKQNSVLELIAQQDPEKLPNTRFYIDCGDKDYLLEGNFQTHQLMNQKKMKHEFRVRDGAHSWSYWQTALPEVLMFVSRPFSRN